MESRGFWRLEEVSDTRLRSDLAELLTAGYRTEARIIAHLAEVEQRKLHLKDGSESLYDYCTRVLRLSNSETFHRITAARIARQFPVVFGLIEQRKLHLTAVCLLRDYLNTDNHQELLAEASHKTKWQVQELLARRFPRPEVESRVRKLPTPRTTASSNATSQVLPSSALPSLPNQAAELAVKRGCSTSRASTRDQRLECALPAGAYPSSRRTALGSALSDPIERQRGAQREARAAPRAD